MKKAQSFSVDNQNLLQIKDRKRILRPVGKFSIDKDNQLIYWLNEPAAWRRQYGFGRKLVFQGKWQLNANYDLELHLGHTDNQDKQDILVLKGEFLSPDRDNLVVSLKSWDRDGQMHIYLVTLSGSWQANAQNKLNFVVKKQYTPQDILTLTGSWQVNKNQEIVYKYEKATLKTKTKVAHTLTFSGYWQINATKRLTYILTHGLDSRFDFRVQIESPNLYPQTGVIKYRLGVGFKQESSKNNAKIISLYGDWKFSRQLGLYFEMNYGQEKFRRMVFGTEMNLNKNDSINLTLTNTRGKPLGMNITFTHRFLEKLDGEAFLRLLVRGKEPRVEARVQIPF